MTEFERSILVITLAVTMLGWVFNYLQQRAILQEQRQTQRDIVAMQEAHAAERNAHQMVAPGRLELLAEIAEWFMRGPHIVELAKKHRREESQLGETAGDASPSQFGEWMDKTTAYVALMKLYDPTYRDASWADNPERWSTDLPDDVPQLIVAMVNLAAFALMPMPGQKLPSDPGLAVGIRDAALVAIEHVRSVVASKPY